MPRVTVVLFKDENGRVPVRDWFQDSVATRDGRALVKCKARLKYLRDNGTECRRPYADYLRAEFGGVNYRILYFFAGQAVAVVAAGLTKEAKVPDKEIELARQRKQLFESDPERYSYYEQEEES